MKKQRKVARVAKSPVPVVTMEVLAVVVLSGVRVEAIRVCMTVA